LELNPIETKDFTKMTKTATRVENLNEELRIDPAVLRVGREIHEQVADNASSHGIDSESVSHEVASKLLDGVFLPYFEAIRTKDYEAIRERMEPDVRVTFEGEPHRTWSGSDQVRVKFGGWLEGRRGVRVSEIIFGRVLEKRDGTRIVSVQLTFEADPEEDYLVRSRLIYAISPSTRIASIEHRKNLADTEIPDGFLDR
jgi:hypothetical protein